MNNLLGRLLFRTHTASSDPAENQKVERRWYYPTFGKVVFLVACFVAFLMLAERFDWSRDYWLRKGWPVLIAIGLELLTALALGITSLLGLILGRHVRFSLRSLIAALLVVSISLSWFAVEIRHAKLLAELAPEVSRLGGVNIDDLNYYSGNWTYRREPPEPYWVRRITGDDFFREMTAGFASDGRLTDAEFVEVSQNPGTRYVGHVCLAGAGITDAGCESLKRWSGLYSLSLYATSVTDRGLESVAKLRNLQYLELRKTNVTSAGVEKLQRALPNCRIEYLYVNGGAMSDAECKSLEGWPGLVTLALNSPAVTDRGLESVAKLRNLKHIELTNTKVTRAGVEKLQRALPNCEINGGPAN